MSEENATATTKQRKRTTRSPQYPAFSLPAAVERARAIYAKEQFHSIPHKVAIQDMGLSATGSTGIRALSALLQFGLLVEEGTGEARQVSLSKEAKQIILDDRPDSADRMAAVRKLALTPAVYSALRTKWGSTLPSDATVRLWLVTEKHYNPESVADLIAAYRATMAYAHLDATEDGAEFEADVDGEENPATLDPFPQHAAGVTPSSPPNSLGPVGTSGTVNAAAAPRRENAPPRKEPPMPAIDMTAEPWDLTIPLRGGKAVLRVPMPLTAENLSLILEAVTFNLKMQMRVLDAEPPADVA